LMEYFLMIFNYLPRSVQRLVIHINICNIFHYLLFKLFNIFYPTDRDYYKFSLGHISICSLYRRYNFIGTMYCFCLCYLLNVRLQSNDLFKYGLSDEYLCVPTLACCGLWKYMHESRNILSRQYSSFILTWINIYVKVNSCITLSFCFVCLSLRTYTIGHYRAEASSLALPTISHCVSTWIVCWVCLPWVRKWCLWEQVWLTECDNHAALFICAALFCERYMKRHLHTSSVSVWM
jgi:hypothetical protein